MTTVGLLVLFALVGCSGLLLAASGWSQPAPRLARAVDRERRRCDSDSIDAPSWTDRITPRVVGMVGGRHGLSLSAAHLRVLGRTLEQHALFIASAAIIGLLAPFLILNGLLIVGLVGVRWYVPTGVAIAGGLFIPMLVQVSTVARAVKITTDLRYQVSAYLDVVTMLISGNTGYEGALEQAAQVGDGQLFIELRKKMRESGARGASLIDALELTGIDLGLDELQQIAATAALNAAEGAPVARTLAAKCATLRVGLATEQEAQARLQTSRLATPVVGMALIFMALVVYPALSMT